MYSHCSLGALLRSVARRRCRVANFLRELLGALALLTAPCFVAPAGAQAGSGRITGTATDSATGRPLVGVQIGVTGTRFRAVTDDAGR